MKDAIFPVSAAILVIAIIACVFYFKRYKSLRRRGRPASPDYVVIFGAIAAASAYIAFVSMP